MKRKEIKKLNTDMVNQVDPSKLNSNIQLPNYLSLALRNAHYYGNLRIKYVSFNFAFLAIFASTLAIFISSIENSIWFVVLPILIGLIGYFIYLIPLLIIKFNTITFDHKDLQHYSCFMQIKDYPRIEQNQINNFHKVIERDKTKKNELKTLILQYIYQANYLRVAIKMRLSLVFGSINFILSVIFSFILLILVVDPIICNRIMVILIYLSLLIVTVIVILINSQKKRLGIKKEDKTPTNTTLQKDGN